MNIYIDTIATVLNLPPLEEELILTDHNNEIVHITNGRGQLNSFYGKSHTKETKELYSKQRSGKNNPMYGKSAIIEQNLRWYTNGFDNLYLPEGSLVDGYYRGRTITSRKPHSEETKKKMRSNSHWKGKIPANRLQVQSPTGKIFVSIKEAATECGLTVSQFKVRNVKNGDWIILR